MQKRTGGKGGVRERKGGGAVLCKRNQRGRGVVCALCEREACERLLETVYKKFGRKPFSIFLH